MDAHASAPGTPARGAPTAAPILLSGTGALALNTSPFLTLCPAFFPDVSAPLHPFSHPTTQG